MKKIEPVDDGPHALISGATFEGAVTVRVPGATFRPRGFQRLRMAWRALTAEQIVFTRPVVVTHCVAHNAGFSFKAPAELS